MTLIEQRQEQIKPGNFMLVAHVAPAGYPVGSDPKRLVLVAPYDPDPRTWRKLPWRNLHDPAGPMYEISAETRISRRGSPLPDGVVGVKTYRDVLDAYRLHPEPKSLGPGGEPGGRNTVGVLERRPVEAGSITHIGKEANLLEELAAGLVTGDEEVLIEYGEADDQRWRRVLDELSTTEIARVTGLHPSTIRRIRSGEVIPRARTRKALGRLGRQSGNEEVRGCLRCGETLSGRQTRYCSGACRQQAYRCRKARESE